MADAPEANPLRDAFEEALAMVDAVPLTGADDGVLVAAGECELRLDWSAVQAGLGKADTGRWAERIAELVLERLAAARGDDHAWPRLAGRVVPMLLGPADTARLGRLAPDVLVFGYAEPLLVAVVVPFAGGCRYVQRRWLDAWDVGGDEVLARALANLRAQTDPSMVQALREELCLVDAGDGLDSARLLVLDALRPELAESGALAAAPARDVLAFVPFSHAGCASLRGLVNLAANSFARWPLPIDPGLFYVAPELALHVPVSPGAGGHPRVHLPRELAHIQAALVAEGKWE